MKEALKGLAGAILVVVVAWILVSGVVVNVMTILGVPPGGKDERSMESERAKAVKAGVAYYALDTETGKIEFKYLDLPGYTAYIMGASRAPKKVE